MRLSYDDLSSLEARLNEKLCHRKLTFEQYIAEWDALVTFSGWTWPEVLDEIDSRWSWPSKVPSPASQC